jgi:hypothetical protein
MMDIKSMVEMVDAGCDPDDVVSLAMDEVSKEKKAELIARFKGKMKKPWPKDKDGDGKINEE